MRHAERSEPLEARIVRPDKRVRGRLGDKGPHRVCRVLDRSEEVPVPARHVRPHLPQETWAVGVGVGLVCPANEGEIKNGD